MPEFDLIVTDRPRHLAPVHRAALHGSAHQYRVGHQLQYTLYHRGVHRVFLYAFRRERVTVVETESAVELPGFRFDVEVAAEPVPENIVFHVPVFQLYPLLKSQGKGGHFYQCIIPESFPLTDYIDLSPGRQLLIISL